MKDEEICARPWIREVMSDNSPEKKMMSGNTKGNVVAIQVYSFLTATCGLQATTTRLEFNV